MMRALHLVAASLAGAAFIHLLIITMVPIILAGRSHDEMIRLAEETGEPAVISGVEASKAFSNADPLFDIRICAFDLSQGPMRVTSQGAVPFHTLTVINDRDGIEFAIVDRLQLGNNIDIEILPESDRARYRFRNETGLADAGDTIPVFASRNRGVVVVRAFNPDAATAPLVRQFLERVGCEVVAFGS
jgi:uncharacterized membrane protein